MCAIAVVDAECISIFNVPTHGVRVYVPLVFYARCVMCAFVWPSIKVIAWRSDHLYFIHISLSFVIYPFLITCLSISVYYCVPILDSIMDSHLFPFQRKQTKMAN